MLLNPVLLDPMVAKRPHISMRAQHETTNKEDSPSLIHSSLKGNDPRYVNNLSSLDPKQAGERRQRLRGES
jgi:hypothetical protein